MRESWDERFVRALAAGDLDPPAPWLAAQRDALAAQAPGRALDAACGLGRHSILLAELGFDVDAVDGSRVAVEHVAQVARDRGLPITGHRLDLETLPELPRPPYAVAVVTNYLQRDLLGVLRAALAPGGLLAAEAFLADPAAEWGPRDPSRVLAPGELAELLEGMDILFCEEATHRGRIKARVLAAA